LIEILLIRPSGHVNRISIKRADQLVSTRQIKAARALLGWSQADLAQKSGVSEPTIARLEAVDGDLGGRENTAQKIRNAIEVAGIQFFEENGGGEGVRLRKPRRPLSQSRK
jgi:transcriptional regulator with XRE-family HTH domain